MKASNIYEYITAETKRYQTTPVPVADGWEWNMYEHVRRTVLYKHSKFSDGANDDTRPNNNIILPIVRAAYRTEGFDVKDIEPFVNDRDHYYKSLLVRKRHPRWARENDIDTFIDELVESYVDFGLALVKNVNDVRPEVVPLQRIAFCDQTDVLGGAIGELHQWDEDKMLEMAEEGKWNKGQVQKLLNNAEFEKISNTANQQKTETPGRYFEIYEVHGSLPKRWLTNAEPGAPSEEKYVYQLQIVAFYKDQKGNNRGIWLYRGKETPGRYKGIKRDPIYGRACGFGGVEELFEPQMWTNYSEIQLKEMLDMASMMIGQTADKSLAQRNRLTDMKKGELLYHEEGKPVTQVQLNPVNKEMFEQKVEQWEQNARTLGSADEALLGEKPSSGTPFRLQALVTQEGKGSHHYRRGKIATFVGEIYRDWVLEYLTKDLQAGDKWIDELNSEELDHVISSVVNNIVNDKLKLAMLNGTVPTEESKQMFKQVALESISKLGNKRFIEIIEDDFKDLPIDVEVNILGKQKDLVDVVEKLTNIFRAVIANPAVLQNKGMSQLFNEIVEASGFSPLDFSSLTEPQEAPQQEQGQKSGKVPSTVNPDQKETLEDKVIKQNE